MKKLCCLLVAILALSMVVCAQKAAEPGKPAEPEKPAGVYKVVSLVNGSLATSL